MNARLDPRVAIHLLVADLAHPDHGRRIHMVARIELGAALLE
jgi:hypothetical protein